MRGVSATGAARSFECGLIEYAVSPARSAMGFVGSTIGYVTDNIVNRKCD